jgi:hypothetical protein
MNGRFGLLALGWLCSELPRTAISGSSDWLSAKRFQAFPRIGPKWRLVTEVLMLVAKSRA